MAIDAQPSTPSSAPASPRSAPARDRLATLFPDPNAAAARPWWQRRRRVLVVVVVVAIIGSGVLAAQAFGADTVTYRTATVASHNVDALLNGVGSVEPVSQASVAFPSAGTVATVNVKVGDTVAIGQALATLDAAKLTQSLHDEQAKLAQAQLVLTKALNGESVSGAGGGTGSSTGGSRTSNASTAAASTGSNDVVLTAASLPRGGGTASLADAQQAVLNAQQKVDAALNTATQALDSATTVCAAAGVGTSSSTTATPEQLTACQTATTAVLTAQTAVSDAQQELAAASKALDALLAQQAANPPTGSGSGSGSGSGTPSGSAGSSSGGTGGSGQPAAASSPSSADLASYQKAVDAAAAQVAVAEQAIAQATIVSPIAGTVEGVNLAVGETVTAASTTANIVVVGAGGYEVTTTVSVDQIPNVKVGQAATFLPDGSKRALDGTVASISLAPDATATTTSYRVVIGLTGNTANLDNGSTGSVSIVTKSARAALAVPTSAVTTIGTRHTVTVLDGSTAARTEVEVGVIGDTWTEITGGVKAGRQVVLADLGEPLPGSATSSSSNSDQPGGGRFPGGGEFPGGAPVFRINGGAPGAR